ncbi:mechanosensitive ion channel family protein [Mastigocoleus testarum]|uniref:Mechanosensitive ion channel protein MscS n=1 Tax=Mastigocoleus testarum BC008 TaxID=371196 RepID=A0A0V7ZZN4_9CYAN|nr:mechanosensitive ion channel family protein [Mastigocoleus testarum]KST69992.1 mechanosensitive ion channel protein MscS [Mastigocoleus testarum BC008]
MRAKFVALAIFSTLIIVGVTPNLVGAQIPSLHQLQLPSKGIKNLENRIVSDWVYLDGRRLFRVAAPKSKLGERLQTIQAKLDDIRQDYLKRPNEKVDIKVLNQENGSPAIYVNDQEVLEITEQDAELNESDQKNFASKVRDILEENLQKAKQERQKEFLLQQSKIAAATGLAMVFLSLGIYTISQRRSKQLSSEGKHPVSDKTKPITTLLKQQQKQHLREVRRRVLQLTHTGIWVGGSCFILGLFPYTRPLQVAILTGAQIPLRLTVIGAIVYITVRLSYFIIDRLTSAFVKSSALITPETSHRLQLRVSTISGVTKSIVTLIWLVAGVLLGLTTLGVDIVPLLAGASLVGVALSLASQNLIKDAINGFLIVLEDQYALGDVINVGDVGGLVENLNLRMTQVRDSEGRLITIPNSEVRIVANLSSRWSRADLSIPVAYQTDIDKALELIKTVGLDMAKDQEWRLRILDTPEVLGIENFGERGVIIRVWIKTQPLKQWDVAREYRRRVKIAFDRAGISIPIPQQSIWVNEAQSSPSQIYHKS